MRNDAEAMIKEAIEVEVEIEVVEMEAIKRG